jgi:hypothetical protein
MEEVIRAVGLYDLVGYLLPGCVMVFAILAAVDAVWRVNGRRFHEPHPAAFLIAAYVTGFLLQSALSSTREWSILPPPLVGTSMESIIQPPLEPTPLTPAQAKDARAREDFEKRVAAFNLQTSDRNEFLIQLAVAMRQAFGTPVHDYYLAEAYVRARGLDSYPATLQAQHAFARGMVVSLVVSALALIFSAIVYGFARPPGAHAETDQQHRPKLFAGYLRLPGPANGRPWILCLALASCCAIGSRIAYVRAVDFDRYQKEAIVRTFYVDFMDRAQHPSNASPPPGPADANPTPPSPEKGR